MIDIEYKTTGLFTIFTPNTSAGVVAWNQMAAQNDGCGNVLTIHKQAVIEQFRKAGYVVRKAKTSPVVNADALLSELGL